MNMPSEVHLKPNFNVRCIQKSFKKKKVIEGFKEMGIMHDQFSTDDISFAVGSVGNGLTRLIETSNV